MKFLKSPYFELTQVLKKPGNSALFAEHEGEHHAGAQRFDVTDRASFEAVKDWHKETLDYAGQSTIVIIIGNKVDLVDHRVVETEEAVELARNLGCTFFETSAKTGENVAAAFSIIALFVVERMERWIKGDEKQRINLEEYLKGRVFPAEKMDKIITLIREFEQKP